MFAEFKPVTKAEWLAKIKSDLKGKPLEELSLEIDGMTVSPFLHVEDAETVTPSQIVNNGWEIGEDIVVTGDLIKSNRRLLAALKAGVNAPRLILDKNHPYSNLAILLEGVDLSIVSLHFLLTQENPSPSSLLSHIKKLASFSQVPLQQLRLGFHWDNLRASHTDEVNLMLTKSKLVGNNVKSLTINGIKYFNETSPALELADIIRDGEQLLQQHQSEQFSPAFINEHLQFSVAIGKNYFVQIAKMRALRLLWANVMKAYEIHSAELPPIDAHLAPSTQVEDANQNMIAATTQAMSAVMGGADRLTVLPSDHYSGQSTAFSTRIARNVQHLLQLESHLDQVADPAAGSYFVEKITVKLAEKAWAAFCAR